MFQADSIIAAIHAAFTANTTLAALCPGGLWHRRAASEEQGVTRPYAVVAVVPQDDKEFISDKSCIQGFLVTVTIYGDQTTSNTGEIASQFCAWDLDRSIFATLPAKVLGFFPANESLDLSPEEKAGRDVVIAAKQWLLKLLHQTAVVPSASSGSGSGASSGSSGSTSGSSSGSSSPSSS